MNTARVLAKPMAGGSCFCRWWSFAVAFLLLRFTSRNEILAAPSLARMFIAIKKGSPANGTGEGLRLCPKVEVGRRDRPNTARMEASRESSRD